MRSHISRSIQLPSEIRKHYDTVQERSRLFTQAGQLEFYRTKELISRYLPRKPITVLDIGGGPGAYACWLAKLGHTVHLVDPVPVHLEQAKRASNAQPDRPLASVTLGEARTLRFGTKSSDVVLFLGPLYHLIRKRDRIRSLSEAFRTLKRGGLLFAAAISRSASALDGLFRGFMEDPAFFRIVRRDLRSGQHRNPTGRPEYFTTAFFHHPNELKDEIREAGFETPHLYAIEGPGWLLTNFKKVWHDPVLRGRLLTIVKATETEPALMGQSAHILAVARKKQ
ncbi:MAG TPA: class I SAM-dependent methyltransferase [Candidatus Acidoferrales bacterium]|nr:class I SAM-dependent methyltransferase [Candidatus Acidoferrales bacterium]